MSADPQPTPSWRQFLKIHQAAELLPLMPPDELRELGEDIKAHGLRVPVTLLKSKDGDQQSLLDGRNRLDAMEAVDLVVVAEGKLAVNSEIIDDTVDFDPAAFVVSANVKRRHLTAEQKRDLIAELLKANPERSDRATAKIAASSHPTVAAVRHDLEGSGAMVNLTTRMDAKGRRQPTKKPARRVTVLSSGEMAEIRRTSPATMTRVSSLLQLEPDRTLTGIERLLRDAKSSLKILPKEKRVAFYRGFMGTLRRSFDLSDADLDPIG